MDQERFDQMARIFGGAFTRRAGMSGALAALAGGMAGTGLSVLGKQRKVRQEGPCGDGSRIANICTRASDCCTGICDKNLGKKNNDGKGRCRCVRKGGDCKADKNCCRSMTCNDGVCSKAVSDTCVVCPSGCPYSSIAAAIDAAADGGVVSIDAVTYELEYVLTKSITLEACNGVAGVTITNNVTNAGDILSVIDPAGAISLTLIGLDFIDISSGANSNVAMSNANSQNVTLTATGCTFTGFDPDSSVEGIDLDNVTATLTSCTFSTWEYGMTTAGPALTTCTGCTFTANEIGVVMNDLGNLTITGGSCTANEESCLEALATGMTLVIDGVSITGNGTVAGNLNAAGAINFALDGSLTIKGATVISGNTGTEAGAIYLLDKNVTSSVTIQGSAVQIVSNTAVATVTPAAGAVYVEDNGTLNKTTFTGISNSNVTYGAANTPSPICITVASGTPTTVTNCAY